MKNIIIAGAPRCGKTTLAKMLHQNLKNYSLVEEDILNTAFYTLYKEYFAKKKHNENGVHVTIDVHDLNTWSNYLFKQYIDVMRDYYKDSGLIITSSFISLKDIKEYHKKGDIVVVLGCPNYTVEEFFIAIREHDTPKNRTFHMGNYSLTKEIACNLEQSKRQQKLCKKLKLDFIDTANDREKVLKETCDKIIEQLD